MASTHSTGFDFNAMDFNMRFGTGFGQPVDYMANELFNLKPEGNTSAGFYFSGDEGIDTTGSQLDLGSHQQSFESVFSDPTEVGYGVQQNLGMENTMGGATWSSQLPITGLDDFAQTPAPSFDSMYQPQFGSNLHHKRPLQLDVQDFPQQKRHERFSPFLPSASVTGSSWTMDTQPTPSSSSDIGLSDEAADVCATWFSKYAVLPSDRHIESLSQLTGESHAAIRHWFSQMLKQGMAGHDSAYKSQTSAVSDIACNNDTQTSQSAPRGGKKGCILTSNPELLCRDPNKIYQCTRKCGKRYGRKCDWKRNEEEGYPSKSWVCSLCTNEEAEKVKPCFRKYHFSQHFRNIHPGLDSADYEAESVVHSDTSFPRKCGFCPYRFTSRQDRIDHIADHFKKGKCMLDWNDDEDDNPDSDNMDDDDDNKPGSDGFEGPPNNQSDKDARGRPGPKQNGNGSNGRGGQGPPSGFGQFQLSQFKDNDTRGQAFGGGQHIKSCSDQAHADGHLIAATDTGEQCSIQDHCSIQGCSRHETTAGDHADALARDVVSRPLTIANEQKQTPGVSMTTSSQPSEIQILPTELNDRIDSNLHGSFSGIPARKSLEDVGPALLSSSADPPVADTSSLAKKAQPIGKVDVTHGHTAKLNSLQDGQNQLRLLTREDGGVRGLSSLFVLKSIMEKLDREEQTSSPDRARRRPKEVLDLLSRTGNGGLIAIMLARLGVDAEQCISAYEDISRGFYGNDSSKTNGLEHVESSTTPNPLKGTAVSGGEQSISAACVSSGSSTQLPSPPPLEGSVDLSNMTVWTDEMRERDICSIPVSQDLKAHMLTHSNVRPEKCAIDTCDYEAKDFARKYDKNRHTLTHFQGPDAQEFITDQVSKEVVDSHDILGLTGPAPKNTSSTTTDWLGPNAPAVNSYHKSQSFLSVKLLGTGGFSTVDEVVHRETNLRVCRKTLKNRDQSAMEDLKKEVNVLQKLRHPHIIRFLGAYSKGDKMSILLSPVAETTLAVWLDKSLDEKPLELASTIVKMFGCLVSSIRYLHEQRPVVKHMDIKPQNILVMHGNQGFPHVVLSDFGISSSEEMPLDRQLKPLTRQYCAPEIPGGFAREQAADIWSLGCVLAEMAAAAFGQENSEWLGFRQDFSGCEGKYYWQDVPRLHERLSGILDQATTLMETTVLRTVKSMLNGEPSGRPNAAMLTVIFTPAPCCLSWPNENASFPSPLEELKRVEMLVREDRVDCHAELHFYSNANQKQELESFTRVKSWLDECSHDHEACRGQATRTKSLPTRLVDIQPQGADGGLSVCIVNGADIESCPDHIDYVVVSHVWNQSDLTLSSDRLQAMQSEIPKEMLPRALNDAINAAERIGYRYIWVDSLCILQDSEEEKRRECSAMASVYRNAALTIVTDKMKMNGIASPVSQMVPAKTSSDSVNPVHWTATINATISSHITDDKPTSPIPLIDWYTPGFAWDTRAWTLQERLLSRRLLHLAGEQMYWECNALKASETFPRGLPPLLWEKVHTKSTPTQRARPHLVGDYQYLRKQGDGIGSPTETQLSLQLQDNPVVKKEDTESSIGFVGFKPAEPVDAIDNVKSKIQSADNLFTGKQRPRVQQNRIEEGKNDGGSHFDFKFEVPDNTADRMVKLEDVQDVVMDV